MQDWEEKLLGLNVCILGIAFTGRTETLEEYFRGKVNSLTVIALSSCFFKENLSACRVYVKGVKVKEFHLPTFRIKDYKWYRQPLIILVLSVYFFSICLALAKVRRRYAICIGASYSFAFWGAIFKRVGLAKRLIYYSMDYYIPTNILDFNTQFIKLLNIVDRFTVRTADYVWDVSSSMQGYRERIGKIGIGTYRDTLVPLGYSRHVRRFTSMDEVHRWEIGFVGSVTSNQGLQLLVEAMPIILQALPKVRVTIIGHGPYLAELKEMVFDKGLDEYFTFLGFIKEESKMLDMLSKCAVGVALYSDCAENRNIVCADPGKPKLYAVCGLPIITTKFVSLSEEILRSNAGRVIDYTKEALKDAVIDIMVDDERLRMFRKNASDLGVFFFADTIFDNVMSKFIREAR
jgi:glycosyltransferase involved in cell wall biosynthesis